MDFSPSDIPARMAVDVSEYPEDVRVAIAAFSELWMIEPPKKRAKPKSFWIQAARDLNEACAELGPRLVLRALFADWNALLHKGQAYTVTDPNSLVKMARAKTGELRNKGVAQDFPSLAAAWASVRSAMYGMPISLHLVVQRAVDAAGGLQYLVDLGPDRAELIFGGEYRRMVNV